MTFDIGGIRAAMSVKRMKTAVITALILSMNLTAACGGRNNSAVILAGSTSVQPYAEVLAEEYALLYPESAIDVQGGGSSAGLAAAESGTADIGMSSRELNEQEKLLWSVEIAKDGLAVIVNPGNPVSDLRIEQVRDIYAGVIYNWSDLGGENANIHIITREEGSGTRSAFESLVMDQSEITPKAIVQGSNGAVRQLVSSDPNSIGFISLGLVVKTVKALRLDGVTATAENIKNGSYSLFRPFLFVTKSPPTGDVKQFVDFTLSAEGQRHLIIEGLIPSSN